MSTFQTVPVEKSAVLYEGGPDTVGRDAPGPVASILKEETLALELIVRDDVRCKVRCIEHIAEYHVAVATLGLFANNDGADPTNRRVSAFAVADRRDIVAQLELAEVRLVGEDGVGGAAVVDSADPRTIGVALETAADVLGERSCSQRLVLPVVRRRSDVKVGSFSSIGFSFATGTCAPWQREHKSCEQLCRRHRRHEPLALLSTLGLAVSLGLLSWSLFFIAI